jgi:hypothetical protein
MKSAPGLPPCASPVVAPFIEITLATRERTLVTGNLPDYPPEILHGARVFAPAPAAAELSSDLPP